MSAGNNFGLRRGGQLVAIAILLAASGLALAARKIPVTTLEWDSWPRYCQAAGHTGVEPPMGRAKPQLSEREASLGWRIGIWHYCIGYIKVMRAELGILPRDRDAWADEAIGNLNYSYQKIPKTEPWAAEMAVTIARAYRVLGKGDKAREYLEVARRMRPQYPQTYSVLSMLHFDREEYRQAADILEEGNEATGGRSAELNYFLGLAYVKTGEIEAAREQAKLAKSLGYPLDGLSRQITEHAEK